MGRMQRNKGARGERELARELTRVLGVSAGSIYRSVQHAGKEGAGDVHRRCWGSHRKQTHREPIVI